MNLAMASPLILPELISGELCSELQAEPQKMLGDLWAVIEPHVPKSLEGGALIGPHPFLQLLEYSAKDHFFLHADTPLHSERPLGRSRLTVLLYLNDVQGGELCFEGVTVTPKMGLVVIFPHELPHDPRPVLSGVKRLLKLSVLYEPPRSEGPAGGETFRALVADAERKSVEPLLDFLIQEDVTSWSAELLSSAFFAITKALTANDTKMKAYKALERCTPLAGHELCILLGETLMKDFCSEDLELRLYALRIFHLLLPNDPSCQEAIRRALKDPEPQIQEAARAMR